MILQVSVKHAILTEQIDIEDILIGPPIFVSRDIVHIVTSTAFLRFPCCRKDFVGQQDAEDLAGRESGFCFEIYLVELISWKG